MNKIIVGNNQSVIDIAIATSGSVEGILSLMDLNADLNIESNLVGGITLIHSNSGNTISKYLSENGHIPATGEIYDAPYYNGEFSGVDFDGGFN